MARRPFADTLRDIRAGEVIDEMESKLQELVHAVQATNGEGMLTLTIKVKPLKGSSEAVVTSAETKLKKPEIKSAGTVMFPTPEGNLTRSNHRQPDLPGITLAANNPAHAAKN